MKTFDGPEAASGEHASSFASGQLGISPLKADRGELERFVDVLFRYADENTFAALRAFHQFRGDVPPEIQCSVKINGDLTPLINRALKAASKCAAADHPIVFAPPICTFTNPNRARSVDLANGLVLSVDIDQGNADAARRKLEALLGSAVTVVVASGGYWADPATGEVYPKLHLHWRLSEPTRSEEEHIMLTQARDLAARLAGADVAGKPVVHPLRWPGSWNKKDKPKLARIVILNAAAEIHLNEALEKLTEAVETAGLAAASLPKSSNPQAPIKLLESAMRTIPNPGTDVHYGTWIQLGYATYRASGGSDHGFDLWDAWSRKSDKYDAKETREAWARIAHAIRGPTPPRICGAGTIFYYAMQAGWKRPNPLPPEARRRYALAALRCATERVSLAGLGMRSDTLKNETFALNRFMAEGLLDALEIATAMAYAGRQAGLLPREVQSALISALSAGARR
jgi:hypothetical protein